MRVVTIVVEFLSTATINGVIPSSCIGERKEFEYSNKSREREEGKREREREKERKERKKREKERKKREKERKKTFVEISS